MKLGEIVHKFWLPLLIIILAYSPWFYYFWQHHFGTLGNTWYFDSAEPKASLFSFVYMTVYYSLSYLAPFYSYFFVFLAFSLFAILGISAFFSVSREEGRLKLKFYPSQKNVFPLLVLLFSSFALSLAHLFIVRYAIIAIIGLFLFLGYGFSRANRAWRLTALLIFLLISLASFGLTGSNQLFPDNWKGVAGFIAQNEQSGDKIVGSLYINIFSLNFYYRGQLPMAAPLDQKYRGDNLLLTAIKTNIYPTTNRDNVGQLRDFIGDTRRIFFIVSDGTGSFPGIEKIGADWLAAQGFVSVRQWPEKGDGQSATSVWLMEKR
jgi:hypothetical protein